jgi:uncharacterized protein
MECGSDGQQSCGDALATDHVRSFKPSWMWSNRHVQSILPSVLPHWRLTRRAAGLLAASQEHILDCGDGVRLMALHSKPSAPNGQCAVLLHGWEGSAASYYVVSLGAALFQAGVEVVRLNLRDHGNSHELNEGVFHSCRLDEVVGAVAAMRTQIPGWRSDSAPWLVGFSLGGNFMLRVAAAPAERVGPLRGAIAVSPVLHPDSAMRAMEEGLQIYQRYFVSKWSRSLRRKQQLWPTTLHDDRILRSRNLRAMTDAMVARHTDFPSMKDYLDGYAITGNRLTSLSCPALILASQDDPIIPAADLTQLALHPELRVVTTEAGGHMGFMTRPFARSWLNDFVLRQMRLL